MAVHWRWDWRKEGQVPAPAEARGPSELAKKDLEMRGTQFGKFLDKSYETSGSAVGRYQSAATVVQTVAASLGALYTGALALVFGADQGGLPARGLLTPAFFALSLMLSLMYLAYLTPKWRRPARPMLWDGLAEKNAFEQLSVYRRDVAELVTRNIGALHGSVLSLGAALVLAPAPFVRDSDRVIVPTPWPTDAGTGDAALELYKAQVAETAAVRAAERGATGDFYSRVWDLPWLVAAGILVIFLAAWSVWITRRERSKFDVPRGGPRGGQ